MNYVKIPGPTASMPHSNQRTRILGTEYVVRYDWNARTDLWHIELRKPSDDSVVLPSRALVNGVNLLYGAGSLPGATGLFIVAMAGDDSDPRLSSFDDRTHSLVVIDG